METYILKLKQWYAANTTTTHAFAAGIAFLVGAYFQVPAFHDFVFHLYGLMPQWVKELIATVVALIGFYRSGQKPATT